MPDHLTRPPYPDRSGEQFGYSLIQSIHNYCESPVRKDYEPATSEDNSYDYEVLGGSHDEALTIGASEVVISDNNNNNNEPLNLETKEEAFETRLQQLAAAPLQPRNEEPLSLVVRKGLPLPAEQEHGLPGDRLQQLKIRDFAKEEGSVRVEQQQHSEGIHSKSVKPAANNIIAPSTVGNTTGIVVANTNNNTELTCDFCDKKFTSRSHLNSHVVIHTGERAFSCPVCSKDFARKSTLRAHMTTHTKQSNFMCEVCEKACNDKNSLEEHKRMHTGEKPFVCSVCSKAYARKSHLNVHFRVHTGERPFACVHCEKDFTEKRFLNDHIQTAHTGKDGPLKCPNCSREFAYKTSLKQHLKKRMCERNRARQQLQQAASAVNGGSAVVQNTLPSLPTNPGSASTSAAAVQQSTAANGGNLAAANLINCQQQQTAGKQFKCPFCEKSYSWKQTLKQHVSMYHRNKVNTDEFWKYELVKNRFSEIDASVKEVLWKKQLGRHLEDGNGISSQDAAVIPKDESIEMTVAAHEIAVNNQVESIEEPMDCSETASGEHNQNTADNNNDVVLAMRSSVQSYLTKEPRRELASSLPTIQVQMSSSNSRQLSSSLQHNNTQISSLPSRQLSASLPTAQIQHLMAPAVQIHKQTEESGAIDYSVRKSTESDRGRPSYIESRSRTTSSSSGGHELIRLLVANRPNIDSNNNNVRMVLDSPSPISRGSSPATTRGSSPSISRVNSPALATVRVHSPVASRVASPSLSMLLSRRLTENNNMDNNNNNNSNDLQASQAVLNNNNERSSTPVDMTNTSNSSAIKTTEAGGDNSLLKALLLKNTESTSSNTSTNTSNSRPVQQQSSTANPSFFQLPEAKTNPNSNNILRKRLLGICDDDTDKSTPERPTEAGKDNSNDNNNVKRIRVEHTPTVKDDTDDLKDNLKSKGMTEEDYKHRSVLKILLYRYNTSHHL